MEMRLRKRAVTDPKDLRSIVERCRTIRIGFTDEEGMAVVPMSFGFEWPEGASPSGGGDEPEDGARPGLTFWLHSAGEGRKARAWARGGGQGVPVAFEMDVEGGVITGDYACSYSLAYESVMGTGVMRPVASGEDKVWGLELIMRHMAPGAPTAFGPGVLDRTAVWRLDVVALSGKRREAKRA